MNTEANKESFGAELDALCRDITTKVRSLLADAERGMADDELSCMLLIVRRSEKISAIGFASDIDDAYLIALLGDIIKRRAVAVAEEMETKTGFFSSN